MSRRIMSLKEISRRLASLATAVSVRDDKPIETTTFRLRVFGNEAPKGVTATLLHLYIFNWSRSNFSVWLRSTRFRDRIFKGIFRWQLGSG